MGTSKPQPRKASVADAASLALSPWTPPARGDGGGAAHDLSGMSPVHLAAMIQQLENERARAEAAEAKVAALLRNGGGGALFDGRAVVVAAGGGGVKQAKKKKPLSKKARKAALRKKAARQAARAQRRARQQDLAAKAERAAQHRERWEQRMGSLRAARDKQQVREEEVRKTAKEAGAKARALVLAQRGGGRSGASGVASGGAMIGSAAWQAQQQALAADCASQGIAYTPTWHDAPGKAAGKAPEWQQQETIFRFGTDWWDDECAKDADGRYLFLGTINGMSIAVPKKPAGDDKRDFSKMTARQIGMLPLEQRAPAEAARKARQKRIAAKRKAAARRKRLEEERRRRWELDVEEARGAYERFARKKRQGGGVGLSGDTRSPLWAASVMLHFFMFAQRSWIRKHRCGGLGAGRETEVAARNWRTYRYQGLEKNGSATALLGESGISKFLATHHGERVFNTTFRRDEWLGTFDSAFPGSKGYGMNRAIKRFGGAGGSKPVRRRESVVSDPDVACARIQAQWRRQMAQHEVEAEAAQALADLKATLAAAPRVHVNGVFVGEGAVRTLQLCKQFSAMGDLDSAAALDARDFWDPVWKFRARQTPAALQLQFEEVFRYRPPELRQAFVELLPGLVALGEEMPARMATLADALERMPVFGTAGEIGPHSVGRMTGDLLTLHCPAPV